MFHVTPISNLQAIRQHGLLPRIGERSQLLGEPVPRVYAFPTLADCECALGQWLGDCFNELEEETGMLIDLVVLEIDKAQIPAEAISSTVSWELMIASVVPPEAIIRVWTEAEIGRAALSTA